MSRPERRPALQRVEASLRFARSFCWPRLFELKLGITLLPAFLAARSVLALEALPDFTEIRHPVTGAVTALVNPAAARHHGAPLPGSGGLDRPPSAVLHAASGPRGLDDTVREAGRRFGLGEPERELVFQGATLDGLRMVHESWEQHWQGVPVFGAGLIVHKNAQGEVTSISGRVLPEVVPGFSPPNATNAKAAREPAATVPRAEALDYETTPRISAARAVTIGRAAAAQSSPALQRAKPSGEIARANVLPRPSGLKPGTTLADAGEPVLYLYNEAFLNGQEASAAETWLVWKFNLRNGEDEEETFVVDAASGKIVKRSLDVAFATTREIYDCGTHFNNGFCYLDRPTQAYGDVFYYGRSEGNSVRGPSPAAAPIYGSTDVDYFYDLMQTNPSGTPLGLHTFYLTKFGRDGANSLGGTGDGINVARSSSRILANADLTTYGITNCQATSAGFAWAGTTNIAVCRGSLQNDLIAHEYSHLVARNMRINADGTSVSLLNQGEGGALNESNSDIMGESYERYMTGTNNWIFWVEVHGGVRDLGNPQSQHYTNDSGAIVPYPDRFYSPNFSCGTTYDSGGIHVNSTVPSHAAYLASQGGSFNNCAIQGLGLSKVEQIWYRALTTYYSPSETFNGAYTALRQACLDLYSPADCDQLTKALQAVELDQPGACSGLPARPATCAPTPVLHAESTPAGPRWFWGADCAGWTLQVSYDLAAGFADVQVITAPGEYVPQASAPAIFCRLNYK